MDHQEKLLHVLSWLLAEMEQAQIRGDAELEMRLTRIAQTVLSVQLCECGLETDVQTCRATPSPDQATRPVGFNSFDTAVRDKNPRTWAESVGSCSRSTRFHQQSVAQATPPNRLACAGSDGQMVYIQL